MFVFALMARRAVSVIVTGAAPQLNEIAPPPDNAATNAASVQLAGVPVPTTPAACTSSRGRRSRHQQKRRDQT